MQMIRYVLLALAVALILGCQQDEPIEMVAPTYPGVDQALWPYFQAFEVAGAARGLSIDLTRSNIVATIEPIADDGVVGQCSYGRFSNPREIIIDRSFWNRSGSNFREMVVFHELGHCYLSRGHLDEALGTGICVSIMRSGTCCCRDGYNPQTRSYYLDELFDINAAGSIAD